MKKANAGLIAESAANGPVFKEVHDSQANVMKTTCKWTRISDYADPKNNREERTAALLNSTVTELSSAFYRKTKDSYAPAP